MLIHSILVRGPIRNISKPSIQANWPQLLRPACRRCVQRRCYAQTPTPASKPKNATASLPQFKPTPKTSKPPRPQDLPIPERLLIYHAGTGRTAFLAMVKVTTIFIGAFFCFILVPAYIKSEKPAWETAGVALAGLVPALFVTYTTAPFVTHIHIHLPVTARASRAQLERFVRGSMPSSTPLTVTTMSVIAKPRYSSMKAGDLVPIKQRLGVVNFRRDATAENADRRWYMFPAVRNFYVQEKAEKARVRYAKKSKFEVDAWVWDVIKERLGKKVAAGL